MRNEYLKTLNLPNNASEKEIKRAYRELAKKYHPDISNLPDSKAKFIEISEAYEMLLNYPDKPIEQNFEDYFDFDFEQAFYKTAQERAKENAHKNFETFKKNNLAFKKSWYYYPAQILVYFIVTIGFLIAFGSLIGPLYFKYHLNYKYALYFYFLALPLSANVAKFSYDIFKESIPYFKNY